LTAKGSLFRLSGLDFKTSLLGGFNVYNCAMAIAIAASQGISMETAGQALAKIESIAGRLEIIDEGQDFTVVVDLAHTPGSFEKVFRLFYELLHNRIISVFGSSPIGSTSCIVTSTISTSFVSITSSFFLRAIAK